MCCLLLNAVEWKTIGLTERKQSAVHVGNRFKLINAVQIMSYTGLDAHATNYCYAYCSERCGGLGGCHVDCEELHWGWDSGMCLTTPFIPILVATAQLRTGDLPNAALQDGIQHLLAQNTPVYKCVIRTTIRRY